jgi:hypothetical protein
MPNVKRGFESVVTTGSALPSKFHSGAALSMALLEIEEAVE